MSDREITIVPSDARLIGFITACSEMSVSHSRDGNLVSLDGGVIFLKIMTIQGFASMRSTWEAPHFDPR